MLRIAFSVCGSCIPCAIASASVTLDISPFKLSSFENSIFFRFPLVAFSNVFKSYEVYGPSVSLPGRNIVYGNPDCSRYSSLNFLKSSTPKAFIMANGNCFRRTTPVLETRKNRFIFSLRFLAPSIRLCSPTLSVISGPLSPSQRFDGKAVVPEQETIPSTPSRWGSMLFAKRWSATTTSRFSASPKSSRPFSALLVTARTRYPFDSKFATTSCPTPPVLPVTSTKSPGFIVPWHLVSRLVAVAGAQVPVPRPRKVAEGRSRSFRRADEDVCPCWRLVGSEAAPEATTARRRRRRRSGERERRRRWW
mmetsp:Transcript_7940/g.19477  ORF Transcript_7940/g.19477 Transcript_7940/m.19477 type:complete len:307 (+) Transcript_7940:270-1190(+)